MPYSRPRRQLTRLQRAYHTLVSDTRGFHVLVLGLLLACAFLTTPARAQERSVVVERRDAAITVLPDGDVRVVETWRPRFRGGPFRFAYFAIPLQRVDDIVDWSVAQDGREYTAGDDQAPGTYMVEDDDGRRKLTWYFEPVTDQTREFRIAYTLRGALRIYPGGDQFFWKFVGDEWETPIEASQVTVTLPAGFQPQQLLTQTYGNGSPAAGRVVDGNTVEFVGGPFQPGDEWEIRAQFPHGVVSAAPAAWQLREERISEWRPVWNMVSLAGAAVVLIGGLLGVYLLWYTRGRDRATGVIAEYYTQPPDELPPGMAGTLLSESAGLRDVLATLVDLARRGYLQIEEQHKGAGIRFVRLKTADNTLRPYERRLLKDVFGKRKERDLSDLKHTFSNKLGALREQLNETLIDEGYVTHNPQAVRTRYIMAGINGAFAIAVGGAIGWVFVMDYAPLAIVAVIAAVIVSIALAIVGNWMPRRTPQGATAAAKWRAFRRYLQHIDRYADVREAREQFERYLPYAIAFGLQRSWISAFAQHNTPVPAWYQPHSSSDQHSHADSSTDSQPGNGGSNGNGSSAAPSSAAPSLDSMAGRGLGGLNAMSAGFFSMLEQASATISSAPAGSSSSGGSFSGGGGSGFGGGGGGGGFG